MKSLPSCLLTCVLALACVPRIFAEEALPMTDPLVSAFFRFDTAGNSNTSGPWRDSYPGCNAVLNTLSHTKNSAGYTDGVELLKHTNPLDPNSNSAKTMVIYFR